MKVYSYNSNAVRTVTIGNEVWFVLRDIGKSLKIKNVRSTVARFPNDLKSSHRVMTSSGIHQMTIISLQGLNRLMAGCYKPVKQFQRWLHSEVINNQLLDNVDTVALKLAQMIIDQHIASDNRCGITGRDF